MPRLHKLVLPSLGLALVACGDNLRVAPGEPDATPSPPDAEVPRPVTLTVTRGDLPIEGVRVFFQAPDSSVVLSATTDATGTASSLMPDGGFVTAIDAFPVPSLFGGASRRLQTFAGIEPGDELWLRTPEGEEAIVQLTLPPSSSGSLYYKVMSTCGNTTGPFTKGPTTVSLYTYDCDGETDILVIAGGAIQTELEYFYVPDVAIAGGATIDLTTHTYGPIQPRTYHYRGVPDTGSLTMRSVGISPHGPIYVSATGGAAGASQDITLSPVPIPDGIELVESRLPNGDGESILFDWSAYAPFTKEVSAALLPHFTAPPTIDAANQSVTAVDTGGALTPDWSLGYVALSSPGLWWRWQISAPYAETIEFPVLPAEAAEFNFAAATSAFPLEWITGANAGGYDAVRPGLISAHFDGALREMFANSSSTGSAPLQRYYD